MKHIFPRKQRFAGALLLSGGLMMLCGCASLFPPPAPVEVSDSQLNWLNVSYRPAHPERPPCRIEIIGAGYLSFQQGKSPLVADSFATDTTDASWSDMTQEKLGMTPAQARTLMQGFVDAGLLAEGRHGMQVENTATNGFARFRWRINNKNGSCMTSRPALVGIVERLSANLTRTGGGR